MPDLRPYIDMPLGDADKRSALLKPTDGRTTASWVGTTDTGKAIVNYPADQDNPIYTEFDSGQYAPGDIIPAIIATDQTVTRVFPSDNPGEGAEWYGSTGEAIGQVQTGLATVDARQEYLEEKLGEAQSDLEESTNRLNERIDGQDGRINEAAADAGKAILDAGEASVLAEGANAIIVTLVGEDTPERRPNETQLRFGDLWYTLNDQIQIVQVKFYAGTWIDYTVVASSFLAASTVGNVLIKDGAVDARTITASEALSAKVGQFLKVTTEMLTAGNAVITNELLVNELIGKQISAARIIGSEILGAYINGGEIWGGFIRGSQIETDQLAIQSNTDDIDGVVAYNATFNSNTEGWTGGTRDTSTSHSGTASLKPSNTYYDPQVYFGELGTGAIGLVNKGFLEAWVKSTTASTISLRADGMVNNTDYFDRTIPVKVAAGQWTRIQMPLAKNTSIFGIGISSTVTAFWIDDVKIYSPPIPARRLIATVDSNGDPYLTLSGEVDTKLSSTGLDTTGLFTVKGSAGIVAQFGVNAITPVQTGFILRKTDGGADHFYAQRRGFYYDSEGSANFRVANLPTTTQAANALWDVSQNRAYRVTSLRAFKALIRDQPVNMNLLNLRIRSWIDRGEADERAWAIERNGNRRDNGQIDQIETVPELRRIVGVVAEEVEELGAEEALQRDIDGNLEGVQYDRLALQYSQAILEYSRQLEGKIDNLKAENETLRADLDAIKAHLGI